MGSRPGIGWAPDLSQMPPGSGRVAARLADFDLSKLKFPGRSRSVPAPRPRPRVARRRARRVVDRPRVSLSAEPAAKRGHRVRRRLGSARSRRRALPRRDRRRRPADLDEASSQAETERDAGALLLRDCGSPIDTRASTTATTCRASSGPAGTWPGPSATSATCRSTSRTSRSCRRAVAEQARRGDGWVKLVGDWIDRDIGDLAPLWSDDVLAAAIDAAHAPVPG